MRMSPGPSVPSGWASGSAACAAWVSRHFSISALEDFTQPRPNLGQQRIGVPRQARYAQLRRLGSLVIDYLHVDFRLASSAIWLGFGCFLLTLRDRLRPLNMFRGSVGWRV